MRHGRIADVFNEAFAQSHATQMIDLIADLIDNYCLRPLRRIYAESYRER